MNDDFLYLWAQWGILDFQKYELVKEAFSDFEEAWKKVDVQFLTTLGFGLKKCERLLEIKKTVPFQRIQEFEYRVYCIDDEEYPALLRSTSSPPPFLFVRGVLPSFHKSIGVVGTRKVTPYGTLVAEQFVSELVWNGFVIVSGLALGVDAVAQRSTVESGGVTVAVLGSGVDRIYPTSNEKLGIEIVESGGAIVSEFPFGTPAMQHHFPRRNRIISGLSKGVLVIEGGVKSGALITARYALEQGREVFAVPHNIHRTSLSGANHLIRRGEAKLVENVGHILEEFQMESTEKKRPLHFDANESQLLELIAEGGRTIDELIQETPFNVSRLSEVLVGLQLKGVVREIGQRWVMT